MSKYEIADTHEMERQREIREAERADELGAPPKWKKLFGFDLWGRIFGRKSERNRKTSHEAFQAAGRRRGVKIWNLETGTFREPGQPRGG